MPNVILDKKGWLPTRARKRPPTTVVLHSTAGGSATSSISWLRKIGLSYHYIIEDDGRVYKEAPTGRVAFHAGVSDGPEGKNVNNYSIGISFANMNDGKEPYTKAQIESAQWLIRQLRATHPTLKWITTHRLISWRRKNDPRGFDFESFATGSGLIAWRKSAEHPWSG